MDISSIASMITTVLQQHLAQRSQGSGQSMTQGLFTLVKNKLSGQPDSATTMQNFEQNPQQHAGDMQNALTQHLSKDPGFLSQATSHLHQISPGGIGSAGEGAGEGEGGTGKESLTEKAGGILSDLLGGKKEDRGDKAA